MQRYFGINDGEKCHLSKDDVFHITHVMRGRINDQFELVDDSFILTMVIDNINPFSYHEVKRVQKNKPFHHITLLYCLPKGDKLDLVVQKATELGAESMIGIISKRTIVRLEKKDIDRKLIRYQKIIKEASEQCFRDELMIFNKIIPYQEIEKLDFDHKFIAYEGNKGETSSFVDNILKVSQDERVCILVGPEGGFDQSEVDTAIAWGFTPISLGQRILRSETAAIMAVGLLSFIMERN